MIFSWTKYRQKINRENILIMGTTSLTASWPSQMISHICHKYVPTIWSHTSATNIFSNDLFYYWCYLSCSATLCLSHYLSFCLCCLALTPHNSGFHFQFISVHNKLIRLTLFFHLEVAHNKIFITIVSIVIRHHKPVT